jgi:hypothetical protein
MSVKFIKTDVWNICNFAVTNDDILIDVFTKTIIREAMDMELYKRFK